jgi:hypothetical protein
MKRIISVCTRCGSENIKITGTVVATNMMLPGKYECMDCGYIGFPLELDSAKDVKKFKMMKQEQEMENKK